VRPKPIRARRCSRPICQLAACSPICSATQVNIRCIFLQTPHWRQYGSPLLEKRHDSVQKALALINPIDRHGNIIKNSRLQDICKSPKGKEVMEAMQRYISPAMLTVVLTLGISCVRAAGQERWGPVAVKQSARDNSELQQDVQDFETDVNTLRESLRRHANQERIARARNRVRQDWYNIVLDRGLWRSAPNDLNQNLADRRGKQIFHHRTRS